MRSPTHHVPEDDLLSYAAGVSSPGIEILVACHLTLCPRCRERLALAEGLGGVFLSGAPAPVGPARALGVDPAPAIRAPAPTASIAAGFPAALRRLTDAAGARPWRALGAGVRILGLDPGGPERTFLIEFPASFVVPAHRHQGAERGLVLQGGFTDDDGHYRRGDVSWKGSAHPHHSTIDADGPCTTLFVADGPARLGASVIDRVVEWWLHGR